MADETFRPERKKVTMNDVQNPSQDDAEGQLEAMARLRAAMAEDEGVDPNEPILQQKQKAAASDAAVKITGNMPPGMQEALAKRGIAPGQSPSRMNQQRRQQPAAKRRSDKPETMPDSGFQVVTGGSDLLKQLTDGVKDNTHQYEEISLPSMGKFYDGTDGPTDGKLWIRPMTGDEEQILATPRFVKKGQAINMIFQRCMRDSYRPEDFLTIDRTYLLIYLRGISYTPDYDVEVKCPECDRKFSHTIDLNSLVVEECPDDYGPPLEDVLPTSKYSFRYKLSRGRDENTIQEYRERRIKMFGDQSDDTLVYRTAMLLDDIEGLEDKKELQKLISVLPINDVAHIRNMVSEPPFGVDTNVSITCANCLQDFEVDLPLEANFFFPRAKKGKRTRA